MLSEGSGLTVGEEFFLVFSPEAGAHRAGVRGSAKYPKLVGRVDEASAARAVDFYRAVLDFDDRPDLERPNGVWDLGSSGLGLAKLAETTYRDVNIGLANQFARFAAANGIDVHQVIRRATPRATATSTDPGSPWVACIPIYPRIYLWNDPAATVVRAARGPTPRCPPTPSTRWPLFMGT